MKNSRFLALLIFCFGPLALSSQRIQLDFYLFNQENKQPIADAHAFLVNTTYGTVSNKQGHIQLRIPQAITEDMLISHISYDIQNLVYINYQRIGKGDTLWLTPNNFDVSEVVVTAQRNNKWKKNYKKFKKVFLGADKASEKCRIINPEVLRFSEEKGKLIATAVDLLAIENNFLGYEINYFLTRLSIESDGSSEYLGKAIFKDITTDKNRKKIEENRLKTYQNSPKFFFFHLIHNTLAANKMEMEFAELEDNIFITTKVPSKEEVIQKSVRDDTYLVQFPNFLKVVNKNEKEVRHETLGVRPGGLESQKFSSSSAEEQLRVEYATSYLFKIAPTLILNKFGNILNTKAIKEYGFWANQRVAHQLPFDYFNEYQMEQIAVLSSSTDQHAANSPASKKTRQISDNQKLKLFTKLIYENNATIKSQLLEQIEKIWQPEFIPILVEFIRLSPDQTFLWEVIDLLSEKTGQKFGEDALNWMAWLWESDPIYPAYYSDFKGIYYQNIDPKFKKYFYQQQKTAQIRLDEIVWGGVKQDGIPPLRNPNLITANDAKYLAKSDIVFGVYINGIAKAYPKRILAWHEFFTDTFGGAKIAGVYCTLCGTVIAYNMIFENTFHDLGTSGFLYRSNKLMYDKATQSLWNTIEGAPVLGPLSNKGISLNTYPIVTTTWGTWKKQYPDTKVLAIPTAYNRDYSEGAAYANYFATDDLMFPVPKMDNRLANKAEVLIIRAPNYRKNPLAISINYLRRKKWYAGKIQDTNFVVVAGKNGARAFDTGNIEFVEYKNSRLKDSTGENWTIKANQLISTNNQILPQLASHNIFWFAWFNSYPSTRLIRLK